MTSVWAPFASAIELSLEAGSFPMRQGEGGWWTSDQDLADGTDYQFRINDELLPDPRSAWQPGGVHGPSRHVDHAAFPWTDLHWQAKPLPSAVIYELHVGTFTPKGTFDAVMERLDDLVELGVTHLELMPVAEFLGDYGWGYDGVFPYAPHHAYGGPNALKRLVNACHSKGLAVLLDVVYNHLGPSGNYLPRFGPYFTEARNTPWGAAINFDGPDSDEVRRYFCDNALMWLRDYHFDGLRLDAVHAIIDTSATHFLEELATAVDELKARLGKHLVLIAESDLNDPRVVRPWELGGFGLDAQWSDDIHHALHTVLTGERSGYYSDFDTIADLATAMTRPYIYEGQYSRHRKRRYGRPAINLIGSRFIAYLQNHDQLGNRARGERLCHLVNVDRAKTGAALVLLSPYVPMLFQGQEWSASSPFLYFVDFATEPELAGAVKQGRQREFASFGWKPAEVPDPTQRNSFSDSKLNWEETALPQHADMLDWHRKLIELRRRISALTSARLDHVTTACDEEKQWLRVERGPITIICNFAQKRQRIPVTAGADCSLLAASNPFERDEGSVILPAETVVVLGCENGSHG